MNTELLRIYLQDHYAGSQVGVELTRRAASSNSDNSFGDPLGVLALDIEADRDQLEQLMAHFDVRPDRVKVSAAWLGEKLGRFKFNGQLTGYSPLSRLEELEAIAIGINGKRALLRTLATVLPVDHEQRARVDELTLRAEQQCDEVETLRVQAARLAFADKKAKAAGVKVPTAST